MGIVAEWRTFTRPQRSAFLASFLGWTLDAFDYFLMVLVIKAVATEFHSTIKAVSLAITLTLAMRPLGALVFGALADRFGRRPVLMLDIMLFSVLEFASAFAPTLPPNPSPSLQKPLKAIVCLPARYCTAVKKGRWFARMRSWKKPAFWWKNTPSSTCTARWFKSTPARSSQRLSFVPMPA